MHLMTTLKGEFPPPSHPRYWCRFWLHPQAPEILFPAKNLFHGLKVSSLITEAPPPAFSWDRLPPQCLKPPLVSAGAAYDWLVVAMSKIVQKKASVVALDSKNKAVGMAQHVGLHLH